MSILLFDRFVWFQYSSVAMDSRHCGGHYYSRSSSIDHMEVYHLLEGTVSMATYPVFMATITDRVKTNMFSNKLL